MSDTEYYMQELESIRLETLAIADKYAKKIDNHIATSASTYEVSVFKHEMKKEMDQVHDRLKALHANTNNT